MHHGFGHGPALRDSGVHHCAMEASNSRRSVKPDHFASLLRNLDGMTTCYDMLFLNCSHVKSDGLVMQLDIHERIEDATLSRQWTEGEFTYPGRG